MLEDEFCDILKKARIGLGSGVEAVASASRLDVQILRALEAGKRPPTREEAQALAAALGLNPDKLVSIACEGWSPPPPDPRRAPHVLTIHGDIGGYAVKGYLFHDPTTREAVMIDTAYNPDAMLAALRDQTFTLRAVCLTHGHTDHAGGLDAILARYPVPVHIGEDDWNLLGWRPPSSLRKFVTDGEGISAGGMKLRFLRTPGHTPGGICYRADECCFVGDTLFAGSIGRANPPSLYPTHLESVRSRLLTLPDDMTLFPGHGPPTTVREEKAHNPFG
jgi:hydroxyacylglutathione hydrolase